MDELEIKVSKIRDYLMSHNLAGILLGKRHNFAWATGGRDNHVIQGSKDGHAFLLFTPDENYVITSNIEMPRILTEELKAIESDFIPLSYDWYNGEKEIETRLKELKLPLEKIRSDTFLPGLRLLDEDFDELRYSLTPEELARYRKLGKDTTEVVENACKSIKRGMSELEIAGKVSQALIAKGMMPTVLLVGADERVFRYRHPIPTGNKVEKYVMVVVCAQRYGLIVALTRSVHFGELSQELRKKADAVTRVDAIFIVNSKSGVKAKDVFQKGVEAYREMGFPEEWRQHHQGGPTGYLEREYLAHPGCEKILQENQPIAWNPSIQGTKSEDTIIINSAGFEMVTASQDWPIVEVEVEGQKVLRPDILIKQ